jgi:hypothetical protein
MVSASWGRSCRNQGCRMTASMRSRLSGLGCSSRLSRSRHEALTGMESARRAGGAGGAGGAGEAGRRAGKRGAAASAPGGCRSNCPGHSSHASRLRPGPATSPPARPAVAHPG